MSDLEEALSAALDRLDLALVATERERDKALLSVEGLSKRLAIALAPREEI